MADQGPSHPGRSRQRQSRSRGLRKTTGCKTCRKRHIKCDEAKPDCGRCLKSGQACIYSTDRTSISQSVENVPPSALAPNVQSSFIQTILNGNPSRRSLDHGTAAQNGFNITVSNDLAPGFGTRQVLVPDTPASSTRTDFSQVVSDSPFARQASFDPAFTVAIERWFDILAGNDVHADGTLAYEGFPELDIPDISHGQGQIRASLMRPRSGSNYTSYASGSPSTSNPQLLERNQSDFGVSTVRNQQWRSTNAIKLLPNEEFLFRNFVVGISPWIDLFDITKNFQTFVPHLALHNIGLMKAILALSARHLSLSSEHDSGQTCNRNDALQYYNDTLSYLSTAMQYDTYKTSLELLATALIVSAYEMLDGSDEDWKRHLQGVFWIQRSQVIHGDSKGLKQAVWWAWLCQDVWAAYTAKRKTFTFWKPTRGYSELQPYELASRSVYLMAQVVNCCSEEETNPQNKDITLRVEKIEHLTKMLDEWKQHLTVEFEPLPFISHLGDDREFQPIWINVPSLGVSLQLYYSARILLLLNKPSSGGLNDYLEKSQLISTYVEKVCGIAMTLVDTASSIMSSQCLFIAGKCVQSKQQRKEILHLIDTCRERTGWPIKSLGDELREIYRVAEEG